MSRGFPRALAVAGVAALTFAGAALAGNTGTVAVSHSGAETTIHVSIPKSDNPIAALNFFVPTGYTVTLGQAAGTEIGKIPSAAAFSYDTSLTLPLTGAVVVADPASIPSATLQACLGTTTPPAAVWMLNLQLSGQSLAVPMFVNPAVGAQQALGSYVLTVCLPPPDVPAGTPGRAAFGAQLIDAQFTVNGIFTPATAPLIRWETLLTPYNPGVGTVNRAGTFEVRSLIAPGAATIKVKVNPKTHAYVLTGTVTDGGAPADASVTIYRGASAKSLSAVATAKAVGGKFTSKGMLGKKPAFFEAKVSGGETDATSTGCQSPLPATVAPAGCISATFAPFTASSPAVRVKP